MLKTKDKNYSLEGSLEQIEHISITLRLIGLFVVVLTIVHIAYALSMLMLVRMSYLPWSALVMLDAFLLLFLLMLLAFYDQSRKSGYLLFEEISDELQWYISRKHSTGFEEPKEKPELRVRLLLRTFTNAADLPLLPGKYGPGIYCLLNIFLAFSITVLLRFFPKFF